MSLVHRLESDSFNFFQVAPIHGKRPLGHTARANQAQNPDVMSALFLSVMKDVTEPRPGCPNCGDNDPPDLYVLGAADERNTLIGTTLPSRSLMNCIRGQVYRQGPSAPPPRAAPRTVMPHYALGATLFPRMATLWRPWGLPW